MPETLTIYRELRIPMREIKYRFARSGGKGGQNVNKVETRVELLFDVAHSPTLSDHQRGQLLENLKSRLDTQGILRIIAQESRSQWRNREEAVRRFVELLEKALTPKKKRFLTKVSRIAKVRRLEEKKRRGRVKQMRRDVE